MKAKRKVAVVLVVVVLALGWLAGRQYAERAGMRAVPTHPSLAQFGPWQPGMNLREAYESLPPAGGKEVGLTLLRGNPEAWVARWRLLADARETLDISYFIVRQDVFGAAFLGHLLQKTRSGVHIRLLVDAQGTAMAATNARGNDYLDTLANTGRVEIKVFRPLAARYVEALVTLNPTAAVASEHDKIFVVDGERGMVGGRNISAEYFAHPADLKDAFEDTDIVLHGPEAAQALTAAFHAQYQSAGAREVPRERVDLVSFAEELSLAYRAMDAWLKGTELETPLAERIRTLNLPWQKEIDALPRLRGALRAVEEPRLQAETRILDSRTRVEASYDTIGQALLRLTHSAEDHILVQTPYLVLTAEAVAELEQAGRRGVAITILTNSPISSDNAMSQAFFLEQWPELLARVPELRIYVGGRPRTVHSKVMIFDDRVTLVGTYNLDPVSMAVNSEIMAAVWSEEFARHAAVLPQALLTRGPPILYEYRIERDDKGQAVRDARGRPIVAFGPNHHLAPGEWRRVQAYWTLVRAAQNLGLSPLF